MSKTKKEQKNTNTEVCSKCETMNCKDCNSQQTNAYNEIVWPGCDDQNICGNREHGGCMECSTYIDAKNKRTAAKKTEEIKTAVEPEIPVEFYNYRSALKQFLLEKDSLEYSIASLKTQLKAVEKRIENMNKQFANGEYTGELFAQKQPSNVPFNTIPAKRHDGPDYDEYLVIVGEKFSNDQNFATLNENAVPEVALYDLITSNPDSATARLIYSKVIFTKYEESGEYESLILPGIDDRSDFQSAFISEENREEYNKYLEKWEKIRQENLSEGETSEDDTQEDKPIHKYNRKSKGKSTNA